MKIAPTNCSRQEERRRIQGFYDSHLRIQITFWKRHGNPHAWRPQPDKVHFPPKDGNRVEDVELELFHPPWMLQRPTFMGFGRLILVFCLLFGPISLIALDVALQFFHNPCKVLVSGNQSRSVYP